MSRSFLEVEKGQREQLGCCWRRENAEEKQGAPGPGHHISWLSGPHWPHLSPLHCSILISPTLDAGGLFFDPLLPIFITPGNPPAPCFWSCPAAPDPWLRLHPRLPSPLTPDSPGCSVDTADKHTRGPPPPPAVSLGQNLGASRNAPSCPTSHVLSSTVYLLEPRTLPPRPSPQTSRFSPSSHLLNLSASLLCLPPAPNTQQQQRSFSNMTQHPPTPLSLGCESSSLPLATQLD